MNKRNIIALFFVLGLFLPLATLHHYSLPRVDAQPDFSVRITSQLQGNVTFTREEFMALPSVSGWATGGDYGFGKYTGVNLTWFIENYGEIGENLTYKFYTPSGFTTTKSFDGILNNGTHLHILAYYYNDAFFPDNDHHLQLLPVTLIEGRTITFIGNQNPWGVRFIDVIGTAEAEQSAATILMFIYLFTLAVLGVMGVVIGIGIRMTRKREASK